MSELNLKRGLSTASPQPSIIDGRIIYHTDTNRLYLDTGTTRKEINANDARSLQGKTITTTPPSSSSSNSTIPTSQAVHQYALGAYMTRSNPTGSGEMHIDGTAQFTGDITIGGCTLSYNTTNKCLDFIFN